uniref:Signal transducer and activator of transcription n=1 Tax=Callorhinchus milii TaxID=7868 RepID=V9KH47_CALMI
MALWNVISKLPPEVFHRFQTLYEPYLPVEVRHYLAEWMEQQPWGSVSTGCGDEALARNLLENMVAEMQNIAGQVGEGSFTAKLNKWASLLQEMQPLQLVQFVNSVLLRERELLQEVQQSSPRQEDVQVRRRLGELESLLQRIQLSSSERECYTAEEELLSPEYNKLQQFLNTWEPQRQECGPGLAEASSLLEQTQKLVLRSIQDWKRRLQLSGNGAVFEDNLGSVQDWCERLAVINCQLQQEVAKQGDAGTEMGTNLTVKLQALFGNLIRSSFLVEKHPPQVLKTQSKFSSSVRFLLGSRLSATGKPPLIRAVIITEQQARALGQHSNTHSDITGEITNNTGLLESNNSTKSTSATLRNMSLKKIKRSDRRGTESVTEEKFAVLFSADLSLVESKQIHPVQALSLPIVVIVHGSQDNNATATVLWDNAFSEVDRLPFHIPERVLWGAMCRTLDMKFTAEVQAPQGLCPEHFLFLAQKVFDEQTYSQDFSARMVSWSQFNKENLPGRTFTFWQWFDGVMELTKRHLKDYWNNGLILGFVSKQYSSYVLNCCENGTFLLRFSDSEIGGITIAWIDDSDTGGRQVYNVQPFTTKDLTIRSLGDRVRDIEQLLCLYPNQAKDQVFSRFYTKETKGKDGYLHAGVKTTVNGEQKSVLGPMMPGPMMHFVPECPTRPNILTGPDNINSFMPGFTMESDDFPDNSVFPSGDELIPSVQELEKMLSETMDTATNSPDLRY